MFLAKKLNRGAGTPAAPADAQFNYVTMLLHGDGTNGAQNNTFVDSSTNNFTITRNGNTTQGSFGPYGDNWGNYFAANSSSYITAPSSSSFSFTGDFTVECWLFVPSISQTIQRIFSSNAGPEGACFFSVGNNAGTNAGAGRLCAMGQLTSPYNTGLISSTSAIPTNTWVHAALVRSGSTVTIYQDGVSVASGTNSSTWNFNNGAGVRISGTPWDSNEYLNGYVSNLRVVKGTAVYTSTFTPSTTPLTAITNTVLLTCQSNRFKDNSSSPFTLTPAGDTSVQRFNPFGASTAYSTSDIGGSGYFDGSGDYLGVPYSANLTMTGDFTAECWVYVTSAPQAYGGILAFSNDSEGVGWNILIGGTTTKFHFNVAMTYTDTATSMTLNAWTHLALVRSGSTGKLYINGVADANTVTTSATATCPTNPQIGRYPLMSDRNFFGYISNTRVIKGTAVYTSNFTPPSGPVLSNTNTQLLLNYTNGAIFDNAMMNDLETVGDAQISTSVKKYGTGSLSFDGTGDWVRSFDNLPIAFGSGDFTVEGWIYLNNVSSTKGIMYGLGSNSFGLRVGQSYLGNVNGLNISRSGVADLEYCAFTFATSTWYHIAVVRSGTTIYFFVNGTQQTTQGSGGSSYNFATPTTGFIIGANNDTNERFNGYIDDFRITKGYARYTANFTAPTAAFLDIGP